MKQVALFLFFLIFPFISAFNQNVDFYCEDLVFKLTQNQLRVDGNYYFRNQTIEPLKSRMIYPFPVDSCYGTVDSVSAFNIIDQTNCIKQTGNKAAIVELLLEPMDTTVIKISYLQKLNCSKAEYILTSTHSWGKKFKVVNYKLICDTILNIDSISYIPDTMQIVNNKTIYFWKKKNFMPDKNFIVYFSKDK